MLAMTNIPAYYEHLLGVRFVSKDRAYQGGLNCRIAVEIQPFLLIMRHSSHKRTSLLHFGFNNSFRIFRVSMTQTQQRIKLKIF